MFANCKHVNHSSSGGGLWLRGGWGWWCCYRASIRAGTPLPGLHPAAARPRPRPRARPAQAGGEGRHRGGHQAAVLAGGVRHNVGLTFTDKDQHTSALMITSSPLHLYITLPFVPNWHRHNLQEMHENWLKSGDFPIAFSVQQSTNWLGTQRYVLNWTFL